MILPPGVDCSGLVCKPRASGDDPAMNAAARGSSG